MSGTREKRGRRLRVEADGGSRGNPGPAGYGAVVFDADSHELLAERSGAIGFATNNVAEYRGLLAGLAAAADLEPAHVEVRLDSKLVVEQMSGRWRIKDDKLRPLATEAAALVREIGPVEFVWIPRERNRHADRLANEAMDGADARGGNPADPADGSSRTARGTGERGLWFPEQILPFPTPEPAEVPQPTRLLLCRHGQTPYSAEHRFSGRNDQELTELGQRQARDLAVAVRQELAQSPSAYPVSIVTSPVLRARRTAEIVAAALPPPVQVEPDAGFTELEFGSWDGLTSEEVRSGWPDLLLDWLGSPEVPPPGGESLALAAGRVDAALAALVAARPGQTVVVVAHVTPIKLAVRAALQAPMSALLRLHLDLGCITEIDWYFDDRQILRRFNDTAHLRVP